MSMAGATATASTLPSPLQHVVVKPVSMTLFVGLFTLALLCIQQTTGQELATSYENPPALETFSSYEDMQRYFDHRNQRSLRHLENPLHDTYIEAFNQYNEQVEEHRSKRSASSGEKQMKQTPVLLRFEMSDAVETSDEVKELIRQYKSRELQQNEKYMETIPPSQSKTVVKRASANLNNTKTKSKPFGQRLNRPKRSMQQKQPVIFKVKYIPFEVTDAREPDPQTKKLIKRMRTLEMQRLAKDIEQSSPEEDVSTLETISTTTKKPALKRSKYTKQWKPKRVKRAANAPEMIKFEISDAKDPDPSLKSFRQAKQSRESKDLKLESSAKEDSSAKAVDAKDDQSSLATKRFFVYKEAPAKVKKSISPMPQDVQHIISHLIKGGGGGAGGGKAFLKYIPAQQMDYNILKTAYPIAKGGLGGGGGAIYGHGGGYAGSHGGGGYAGGHGGAVGGGGGGYGKYAHAVPVKFVYQPVVLGAVAGHGGGGGGAGYGGGHGGGAGYAGGHGGGGYAAGGGGHEGGAAAVAIPIKYVAVGGGEAGYGGGGEEGQGGGYGGAVGGHGGGYGGAVAGHAIGYAVGGGHGGGGGYAAGGGHGGGGGGYEAGGVAVKYVAAGGAEAGHGGGGGGGYGGGAGYEAGAEEGAGGYGGYGSGEEGAGSGEAGGAKAGGYSGEAYGGGGEGAGGEESGGEGAGYAAAGGHGAGYAAAGGHGGGYAAGGIGLGAHAGGGHGGGGGVGYVAAAPIVHPIVVADGGGGGGQQKAGGYGAGFAEAGAAKNAGNEAIQAIPAPQFKGETKYSVVPTVEQYAKTATQDFQLKLYSPESLIAKAQLEAKDKAQAIAEEGQKAVAAAYELAAGKGAGGGGYALGKGGAGGGYGAGKGGAGFGGGAGKGGAGYGGGAGKGGAGYGAGAGKGGAGYGAGAGKGGAGYVGGAGKGGAGLGGAEGGFGFKLAAGGEAGGYGGGKGAGYGGELALGGGKAAGGGYGGGELVLGGGKAAAGGYGGGEGGGFGGEYALGGGKAAEGGYGGGEYALGGGKAGGGGGYGGGELAYGGGKGGGGLAGAAPGSVIKIEYHAPADSFAGNYKDIPEFKQLSSLVGKSPEDQIHGLTYLLAKEMQNRLHLQRGGGGGGGGAGGKGAIGYGAGKGAAGGYAAGGAEGAGVRPQDNKAPVLFHPGEGGAVAEIAGKAAGGGGGGGFYQPIVGKFIGMAKSKQYIPVIEAGEELKAGGGGGGGGLGGAKGGAGGGYGGKLGAYGLSGNYKGLAGLKGGLGAGGLGAKAGAGLAAEGGYNANTYEEAAAKLQSYASKYAFGYRIRDFNTGNDFGHKQNRDLHGVTRGQYHILLPDGRIQNVIYHADDTGFHADVSFESGR